MLSGDLGSSKGKRRVLKHELAAALTGFYSLLVR